MGTGEEVTIPKKTSLDIDDGPDMGRVFRACALSNMGGIFLLCRLLDHMCTNDTFDYVEHRNVNVRVSASPT